MLLNELLEAFQMLWWWGKCTWNHIMFLSWFYLGVQKKQQHS